MNDFEELSEWHHQAQLLLCSMNDDKIYNIMWVALTLRNAYLKGKDDGVKEWNNLGNGVR